MKMLASPRRRHEKRGGEQQAADGEAIAPSADGERGERRAEQRRGADDADLELAETEREQVGRQHHGDEAVGEGAQATRWRQPAHRRTSA
jgi:hypothetical protein